MQKLKTAIPIGTDMMHIITENELEQYRADTFHTKEPETLAWIDSFAGDSVFYDVGANIGLYSIYCAMKHPQSLVYAFEPVLNNYVRLVENIKLNNCSNIIALPIALGGKSGVSKLFIPDGRTGNSGAQIDAPVNECGHPFIPASVQHVLTSTVCQLADGSIFGVVAPDHIKVDVDGHEVDVLNGAFTRLFACRSALVEINKDSRSIYTIFDMAGFTTDNVFNRHPEHSRLRRKGFPENVVFTR